MNTVIIKQRLRLLCLIAIFTVVGTGLVSCTNEPVSEENYQQNPADGVEGNEALLIGDNELFNLITKTLPSVTMYIEGDLNQNYVIFQVAAAPADPYYIVDLNEWDQNHENLAELRDSVAQRLPAPGLDDLEEGNLVYPNYSAEPQISPDGSKLIYSYYSEELTEEEIINNKVAIYVADLELPLNVTHKIILEGETFAQGILPVWNEEQTGIYYVTPKGLKSYSFAKKQAEIILPATELTGLIMGEDVKSIAPHAISVNGRGRRLAYLEDEKIKIVSFNDNAEEKTLDTEAATEITDLEFLFNGQYIALNGGANIFNVDTGEVTELKGEGRYISYAWNDQEELLVLFVQEDDVGDNLELRLYNSELESINQLTTYSPATNAVVTDLGGKWGLMIMEEEEYRGVIYSFVFK
ncbi:hypothetical protein [Dethiobacter alkaliphilus]|uniref:Lipoprotein n=1 Tax=Dethiobacter alkaliphilus AHT 1 TaxID=555088 RepID=C0GH24_DETAL|nr:hypothetical protein [Dethiobacter alkaliphilus]EEG77326.1 hypothetical protein DealDRAFT_1783 [Dethiobacter alkaliphilus AHT 1]